MLDEKVNSIDGIRSCIKQPHICVIEDHIMCVFLKFVNKDIIFGWVPSHISLLWQTKVGVPYNDFKHLNIQYIIQLDKMIGMVWSQTSFIPSSQS